MFVSKVFEDKKCAELLLHVILLRKIKKGIQLCARLRKEERMEAEYEAHLATAKILLKQGVLSYEQISEATKLSINDIKSLKEN